jgi:hypothetical protein
MLPGCNWAVAGFVAAAGRGTGAKESERPSSERGGGGVPAAERGIVGPVCDASERRCDWPAMFWAAKRCSGRRERDWCCGCCCCVKNLPSPAGNTCLDRSARRAGMQTDAGLGCKEWLGFVQSRLVWCWRPRLSPLTAALHPLGEDGPVVVPLSLLQCVKLPNGRARDLSRLHWAPGACYPSMSLSNSVAQMTSCFSNHRQEFMKRHRSIHFPLSLEPHCGLFTRYQSNGTAPLTIVSRQPSLAWHPLNSTLSTLVMYLHYVAHCSQL